MTIASLLATAGPLQSLKPPKAHKLFKFTESTQALKARKRTRGPNEITIQNKAPRQYPGNTPSSKGSGMAPGPCLGAQRRKIRLFKTIDLGATVMENWPPDRIVFLLLSRFWINIFAAWNAKYQLLIGIFLGIRIPITRPIFEAQNDDFEHLIHKENYRSWNSSGFARFADVNGCPPAPTYHAPDSKMT